ncbi:MAG: ABC transporter ATP-binding protein [Pseudomonadota bacterium]
MASEIAKSNRLIPMYRRFWRDWLYPHRGLLFVVLGLTIVTSVVTGAYAKLTQLIIMALNGDPGAMPLIYAPLAVLVMAVAKGVTSYLPAVLMNDVLSRVELDLRKAMYKTLLRADLARLGEEASSQSATRFSVDAALARSAAQQAINGLTMLLIIASTTFFMLSINWQLTLAFLSILALAIYPIMDIGRRMRRLSARGQEQAGLTTRSVTEGLGSIRLVRSYGLEQQMLDAARENFQELRVLNLKSVNSAARIRPILELLGGVALAGLLLMIALVLNDNETIVADFVGLLAGMGLIAPQAQRLGRTWTHIQGAMAGLDRIFALLDAEEKITSPPNAVQLDAPQGEVTFDGVSFDYPDGSPALRNVSFTASPGQQVALVGRSGAGKTTIFSLLPRLYDVIEGGIRVDGHDVRSLSIKSLRNAIALVSQDALLLTGTIRENIRFGRADATDADVEQAAKMAAAHDFIMEMPDGYETIVAPETDGLSGGQRQRVSIARAMLRDAPVLLLDEPTSALDAESEAAVRASLDTLLPGKTTLVIAHRLATILSSDLILVMDAGQIVESGTHEELLAKNGFYADLVRLQFDGATG